MVITWNSCFFFWCYAFKFARNNFRFQILLMHIAIREKTKILNMSILKVQLQFFFILFYFLVLVLCKPGELAVKQTAIHGGHMCKAPSASTAFSSVSKTATSACSFYSSQHMSLRWWQSCVRLLCCSCLLVQTYIFRYLSAFIIPSSVAADKGS